MTVQPDPAYAVQALHTGRHCVDWPWCYLDTDVLAECANELAELDDPAPLTNETETELRAEVERRACYVCAGPATRVVTLSTDYSATGTRDYSSCTECLPTFEAWAEWPRQGS
jgi:hypothetical protein